jgi:hypothetical protein
MLDYSIRTAASLVLPDRYYAKLAFLKHHGRFPRTPPVTFNERLSDLIGSGKLEKYQTYSDKLAVRDYVARKVGLEYLVPQYATADQLTKDLWDRLPESFILKPNHGAGWSRLVRNKSADSFDAAAAAADSWLKQNFYFVRRERQYRNIEPRLIFEQILTANHGDVPEDYKFFCFHGKARMVQVTLRNEPKRRLLYDLDWNKLRVRYTSPNDGELPRPATLGEMKSVTERLAERFEYVRVDLYSAKEGVFFGELTLTPLAGSDGFDPPEFDEFLGGLWANPNAAPDMTQWHQDATPAKQ